MSKEKGRSQAQGVDARLDQVKTVGAVGAVLSATIVGAPIGHVLVWLSLRKLGNYYNDERIKRNALLWLISSVVGMIATIIVYLMSVNVWMLPLWTSPSSTPLDPIAAANNVIRATAITAGIFGAISALFLKKAYAALTAKSGVDFNSAATLYLFGPSFVAVIGIASLYSSELLPLIFIGVIAVFVSWAYSIASFYSIGKPNRRKRRR